MAQLYESTPVNPTSLPRNSMKRCTSSKKRDKWYFFTKMLGLDRSAFDTVEHAKHRERRAVLNPLFSPASVRQVLSLYL